MRASLAALAGVTANAVFHYLFGFTLWTDVIAEWIMARTPSHYAVPLMEALGTWAKPFAATGGLAALGFFVTVSDFVARRLAGRLYAAAALALLALSGAVATAVFEYPSLVQAPVFWAGAWMVLAFPRRSAETRTADDRVPNPARRQAFVMTAGTAFVAIESFLRDRAMAARAAIPRALAPFPPPLPGERETFGRGLVRKLLSPIGQFYVMSKNTVDPAIDPATWRLKLTADGKLLREISYQELLALPRTDRFQTLRCISNTLKSDLMSTAHWSGVHLEQLIDRRSLPANCNEAAIIGVDGHGDAVPLDYAFSRELLLALGMEGKTLTRSHGFPVRLLVPRYYGFKNIKWIGEIAFRSTPYIGTWPKLGYTREPVIHTCSHIDRYRMENGRALVGGASFAGVRGIRHVQVRAGDGEWMEATLEPALSEYTLTRWFAEIPVTGTVDRLEARAMDGTGQWQATQETPLFPDGVKGPTIRKVSS